MLRVNHIVVLMLAALASHARASEDLRIYVAQEFFEDIDSAEKKKYEKDWQDACKLLGDSLSHGKGPWGYGFFDSSSCIFEERSDKTVVRWFMTIGVEDEEMVSIALKSNLNGTEKLVGNEIKFKAVELKSLPTVLKDHRFRNWLASYLLDQLPGAVYIGQLNGPEVKLKAKTVTSKNQPEPYKDLTLYQLSYDKEANLWRPVVVGSAKLKTETASLKGSPDDQESEEPKEEKDVELVYEATTQSSKIDRELPVWGHNTAGPGTADSKMSGELGKYAQKIELNSFGALKKAALAVAEGLKDTVSGGYVGMRYGYPLDQQQPLVSKTQVYGLLVEIRGGPVEGLRVYYNIVPEVTDTEAGQKYKYGWNRTVIGWSFGWKMWPFDRWDIVPKIGVWNFDAKIPQSTLNENNEIETTIVPFTIDNALALGVEGGVETYLKRLALLRLWGSSDTNLLGDEKKGKVTALRGGFDVFIDGPRLGSFLKLTFLTFYLYEKVELTKSADEGELPGLEFAQSFLGLGLSLSW